MTALAARRTAVEAAIRWGSLVTGAWILVDAPGRTLAWLLPIVVGLIAATVVARRDDPVAGGVGLLVALAPGAVFHLASGDLVTTTAVVAAAASTAVAAGSVGRRLGERFAPRRLVVAVVGTCAAGAAWRVLTDRTEVLEWQSLVDGSVGDIARALLAAPGGAAPVLPVAAELSWWVGVGALGWGLAGAGTWRRCVALWAVVPLATAFQAAMAMKVPVSAGAGRWVVIVAVAWWAAEHRAGDRVAAPAPNDRTFSLVDLVVGATWTSTALALARPLDTRSSVGLALVVAGGFGVPLVRAAGDARAAAVEPRSVGAG